MTITHPTPHAWQFFRAGGVDQVRIRSGADIANLASLDQKLWVALACPVKGLEFDPATLACINTNGDGRIRAPELIAACEWAVARVSDPDVLARGGDVLRLDSLRTDSDEGRALLDEAQRILAHVGRDAHAADAGITLEDVQKRLDALHAMPFNGDGILNPAKVEDQELAALLGTILATCGSTAGVDGAPGVAQAQVEDFFARVQHIARWHADAPAPDAALPTLEAARAAAQAVAAVAAKVDDYFARVELAAFDARALSPLNPAIEGYTALSPHTITADHAQIAALPLAPITARAVEVDASLPLTHGVNPAWAAQLRLLRDSAVRPLLGAQVDSLTPAQWAQVRRRVAAVQQWLGAQPAPTLPELTQQAAQQLLQGDAQARLLELITRDSAEKARETEAQALRKLILLQRDLLTLLNNFVSFAHFYRREQAIFQAGTLYLDGRSCDLTLDVNDPGSHAALAGLAKMYLAYCECRRGDQKRHIVAAFTAGDVDFLFKGRRGVFYDRQGRDWDAQITNLIENPISIWQAFFAPYKKFLRMVEEQVAKRAAEKDASVVTQLGTGATNLVKAPATDAAAKPVDVAIPRKMDVGTVAALGVALGSISTVLVAIMGQFVELGPWIPVALLGVMLAISGPSMLIAWLKLRARSLGPLLDASGWAINGRMKINLPLGSALSQVGRVPLNARRSLDDPYAGRSPLLPVLLAVVVLVLLALGAWRMQWLDPVLPTRLRLGPPVVSQMPGKVPAPAATAPAAAVEAAPPAVD